MRCETIFEDAVRRDWQHCSAAVSDNQAETDGAAASLHLRVPCDEVMKQSDARRWKAFTYVVIYVILRARKPSP